MRVRDGEKERVTGENKRGRGRKKLIERKKERQK